MTPIRRASARALACALLLAACPALGQSLASGKVNTGTPTFTNDQNVPLQLDASGALKVTSGGGGSSQTGSVTAPGTSGTQAQAVQGINGGVPIAARPLDNWEPAGYPLTVAATGPQGFFEVPDGAYSASFELIGTASLTIESSSDATDVTTGTWTATPGSNPSDTGSVAPSAVISPGAGRRRLFPLTAGRRYRISISSFTAGAVVYLRLRSTPYQERGIYVGSIGAGSNVIGSTTIRSSGTNRSTTVGTTAIVLMVANGNRNAWKIKNDTAGDLWINFDGTATATAGGGNIKVPAGSYLASEPGFVETGAMSAVGSAAGLAITAREH